MTESVIGRIFNQLQSEKESMQLTEKFEVNLGKSGRVE